MTLPVLAIATRLFLGSPMLSFRSRLSPRLGNLALRYQLIAYRRTGAKPHIKPPIASSGGALSKNRSPCGCWAHGSAQGRAQYLWKDHLLA